MALGELAEFHDKQEWLRVSNEAFDYAWANGRDNEERSRLFRD